MQVTATALADVKIVEPVRYGDDRGYFRETFNATRFAKTGLPDVFVQDNHSWSAEVGTLRGLHFQTPPFAQSKLVWVLNGAILDVAVDIRRDSPDFGRHVAVELRAGDGKLLFVPKGFAHGFVTIAPNTEVHYKVDASYAPDHDAGLAYDDPDLGIDWPDLGRPYVLSNKDEKQPAFAGFASPF